MNATPGSVKNDRETTAEVVETAGLLFADDSGLELVSTSTGKPSLLFWANGRDPIIALQVERDGMIYRPPSADPSVWEATTLPTEVADRGAAAELFGETKDLFRTYVGMSTAEGALATAWNAISWFADVLLNLPTLFIHGQDMSAAMTLLRLFSCIARHGLILTEINRPALCCLMKLQPSLLINQPQMSRQLRALCTASNYKGVVVPDSKGGVLNVACSKVIFLGTPRRASNDPGIDIVLPPASTDRPPLDVGAQLEIKQRFQPWYLSHRIANLREVRQSRFAGTDVSSPMVEVARMLESCTRNGGQLKLEWGPLLRLQEEDEVAQRFWDPVSAMLEVLWPMMHSPEDSVSMKRLTELANTLLRSRGEVREYRPEALGIRLSNEGVLRVRKNAGMVVMFDRQNLLQLHRIARSCGVGRAVTGCVDCREMKITAEQAVG